MTQWDIAVLTAAKEGSENALAAVIARMMPAIRRGARSSMCPGLDFEDAVQEGLIGLFKAVNSYDASQTVRFETYALTCIRNAQRSAHRMAIRKKHSPLNNSVPLSEREETPGPEELLMQKEFVADTLSRLDIALSGMERKVFSLYLNGSSVAGIAGALHIDPKAAENALGRARRKLKRIL